MLKLLKYSFLTLNTWSRILFFFLLVMVGVNIYGCLEARYIGSFDRSLSHAIYAITLLLFEFVILHSSYHMTRASKFYLEAKKLCGNDFEEKRMAMYEKLLEKNEEKIQQNQENYIKVLSVADETILVGNKCDITWEVTLICNYGCSYCEISDNSKKHSTSVDASLTFLNELAKKKDVTVTLFGGEPTTHPKLGYILSNLKCRVRLFTNLGTPVKRYLDLISLRKDLLLQATYHPDKTTFPIFYEKIKELKKELESVTVIYLLDRDSLNEDTISNITSLKELGVIVEPHKIIYDRFSNPRDLELDTFLKNTAVQRPSVTLTYLKDGVEHKELVDYERILNDQLNNFKFFKCQAGVNCLYISSAGNIYPCLDYRFNRPESPLGSVSTYQVTDLKETICLMDACVSDLNVPKERVLGSKS